MHRKVSAQLMEGANGLFLRTADSAECAQVTFTLSLQASDSESDSNTGICLIPAAPRPAI